MDAPTEPRTEETGVRTEQGTIVELLLENEEKCSEKMKRNPPYNRTGSPFYVPTLSI